MHRSHLLFHTSFANVLASRAARIGRFIKENETTKSIQGGNDLHILDEGFDSRQSDQQHDANLTFAVVKPHRVCVRSDCNNVNSTMSRMRTDC